MWCMPTNWELPSTANPPRGVDSSYSKWNVDDKGDLTKCGARQRIESLHRQHILQGARIEGGNEMVHAAKVLRTRNENLRPETIDPSRNGMLLKEEFHKLWCTPTT